MTVRVAVEDLFIHNVCFQILHNSKNYIWKIDVQDNCIFCECWLVKRKKEILNVIHMNKVLDLFITLVLS